MFQQFAEHSEQLMADILTDLQLPPHKRNFQPVHSEQYMAFYELEEMQVKLVLPGEKEYEWEASKKSLQHEFKTFEVLYRYLPQGERLKVPLTTLCEMHGCFGLFKMLPVHTGRPVRMREVEPSLATLKEASCIDFNFYEKDSSVFVEMDEFYYSKFKSDQDPTQFNYFFLMEVNQYLPPDI